MSATLRAAVRDLYGQVRAPAWARPNLDALADVLRDLSWLPVGPVEVRVPATTSGADAERLARMLDAVAVETAGAARPVRVVGPAG